MQIVDRRLNPKAKSLGNRQRFLRRAKAEIREAIKDSLKTPQGVRGGGLREGHHPLQEPARALLLAWPQQRRARLRAARQRGVPGRRRDPQAPGRRRARQPGQPGRRGPGRVHLHADEGGVPRSVLRRPEAAQPDQGQAQGPEGAQDWRAPASPPTVRRPGSTTRAPCARAWAAAWRCAARARPRSSAWRRSWRRPRPRTRASAAKIAELRASLEHKHPAQDAPSPTSIPSTCSTTASSACPSRPRRR